MDIPFTISDFLGVFKRYNEAVYPIQILAYLLGVMAVILIFKQYKSATIVINTILALFWIWIGIVYHNIYFVSINDAAVVFGAAFLIQGFLFLIFGVFIGKLNYRLNFSEIKFDQTFAIVLIVYAMIIYPLFNQLFGHPYPYSPIFGLAPCPTVIFTFGILLLSDQKVPFHLLVIPFLWSLVGFSAAISLGMIEDYGLVIAGIMGLVLLLKRNKSSRHLLNEF